MTDIKLRSKFPFTVVSSSINTGYAAELTASVGQNIDIVNYHKDEYGELEGSPAQGPFTKQHVGGNQHRHIKLNDGSDSADNRPEAFIISPSTNSIKIYGPDINGVDKPRAQRTRGLLAKSPVNINNIETSGNVAGNFNHNYEVVQTVGRRTTNNLINDNFIASGALTTQFVTGSHQVYTLPDITNNSKSIFVERFNAPGGKEESSRGTLDREGEEYSSNNSLVTRNIKIRQPFYEQLTNHQQKLFIDLKTISQENNLKENLNLENLNLFGTLRYPNIDRTPHGMFIRNDGKKLYTVGRGNTGLTGDEFIEEFNLDTPWDITTAEFVDSFSTFYQETHPAGIFFKPDGTKVYIVGRNADNVVEYNLSIPWSISAGSISWSAFFNISGQDSQSEDIFFKSDGTKMFVVGTSNNKIYQYSLLNPWSISSGVTFEKSTALNSPLTNTVKGGQISLDGKYLFIINNNGASNNTILKYILSTNWDIGNITLDSSADIESYESAPEGLFLNPFGNILYTIGGTISNAKIIQFLFFSQNTSIHKVNKNSIQKIKEQYGVFITASVNDNFWVQHAIPATDLRYKWIADSVSSSQQPIEYQSYGGEYTRAAAFTDLEFEQQTPFGDHLGISGAVDKEEMYTSTYTNTMYRERKYLNFTSSNDFYVDASDISSDISSRDFSLSFWVKIPEDTSVGRNLESLNFIHSSSVLTQENGPTGMFIDSSGVRLFVIGVQADSVHQYSLSTAWDITSKTFVRSLPVTLDEGVPTGLFFKSDGTRMYVVGSNNSPRTLKQYDLGTAWNISTVGAASTFGFGATAIPQDLFISPDGTKMFIVRSDGDVATEYNLLTPWDATTAVFVRTVAIVSTTPSGNHTGISFSHDGRYMYILRNEVLDSQDDIFMYYLPNAWSLLGATLVNSKNIGDKLNIPRGMFVKPDDTTRMYVIGDMGADSLIYEFSLNNIFDLINYSGSASDNYLKAAFTETSSYLYISGSEAENNILIKPQINDSLWHNIVLVSDVSTAIRRITTFNGSVIPTPQNTTVAKIYVDGALVTETTQLNKKLDISKLIVSAGRYGQTNNSTLDEISVWDSVLSEQQVNEIFKISKSAYGKQPKKYKEHLFDSDILQEPLHVYSSRVDNITNIIFDEMSKQDITLVNYTASANLKPDTNQIISYSTYFNGPYGSSNWKSIRNNEHPVTRNLSTQNTNIISVLVPESNRIIRRKVLGVDGTFTLPPSKKQGTLLNVKEPPVSINKPLKHRFIFKGDTYLANKGYEITHTYQNNIKYFSNQELNDAIGLRDKTDEQMYDVFYNYYANDYTDEKDSPIEKFLGYTYNETIFPKPENAFLKETRMRTDYITDQPGFSIDGYDRQLGTQRVFWRDSQEDRQRTQYGYINSMGNQILTASDGATSIAALEFINESDIISSDSIIFSLGTRRWYSDIKSIKTSELNSFSNYIYELFSPISNGYSAVRIPIQHIPERYFTNNNQYRQSSSSYFHLSINSGKNIDDYTCYRAHPSYIYQHPCLVRGNVTVSQNIASSSIDLGLTRLTEKISGKNPFYDSYEKYSEDFINLSKNYSILNEFNISEHIKQTIKEFGGDFRKIKFINFDTNINILLKDKIQNENNNFVKQNKISFKLSAIKKLLPYNGFYPQDRSLQLVNNLKNSFIDTGAVIGGVSYSSSVDSYTASFYDNIEDTSSYTLQRYQKEMAFLEPFYAPGIFYNLIKSGVSTDWTVYTGSITDNFDDGVGGYVFENLANPPIYKIPFEAILDIFSGVSQQGDSRKINRTKELSMKDDYSDFDPLASTGYSKGFFELINKSDPNYSLSINNFLAETINFFLKDSKLNSYVSVPEESFSEMDENKTYYMDVVLRKTEDFVMIDAYSSSINNNFGKMSGRYFGPSYYTGSSSDEAMIKLTYKHFATLLDPAYAIYTPPYFYGDSVARISFKPYGGTRKYSLSEIISNSSVEYFNLGLLNNTSFISGNLYNDVAMNVGASINLFDTIQQAEQTTEPITRRLLSAKNNTGNNKWVISTKMESPVLNFINQNYIDNTTLSAYTPGEQYVIEDLGFTNLTPLTASGFGIGMWSGYGEIPTNNEGIFFDLKESYPNKLKLFNLTSTTGSLIEVCGFQKDSKRIGEIADKKIISEAIVIIPYSTNQRNGSIINADSIDIRINDTTKVENFNLFKIHRRIFDKQKTNLEERKAAIQQGNFGAQTDIEETSISRMIETMQQYVIPPNLNFLEFDDIQPFVMYFAEFKTTLDKQDLADIWQGVMPKPAMKAELENVTISQNNTLYDFFHGEGLPEDVRFMIFKVKKKAEINYYKMTADSTDDNLFPEIQVGKGVSSYGYNWPYDYFSLVELAKVDIEIDYESKDNEQVTIPSGNTIGQALKNATVARTTAKNSAVRGIIKK